MRRASSTRCWSSPGAARTGTSATTCSRRSARFRDPALLARAMALGLDPQIAARDASTVAGGGARPSDDAAGGACVARGPCRRALAGMPREQQGYFRAGPRRMHGRRARAVRARCSSRAPPTSTAGDAPLSRVARENRLVPRAAGGAASTAQCVPGHARNDAAASRAHPAVGGPHDRRRGRVLLGGRFDRQVAGARLSGAAAGVGALGLPGDRRC